MDSLDPVSQVYCGLKAARQLVLACKMAIDAGVLVMTDATIEFPDGTKKQLSATAHADLAFEAVSILIAEMDKTAREGGSA